MPRKLLNILKVDEETNGSTPSIYSTVFEGGGLVFLIVMNADTFYSSLYCYESKEQLRDKFSDIFNQDVVCGQIVDKSELSNVTNIAKKAAFIIDRALDRNEEVPLQEIKDMLNGTPWKFLDYRSPLELEQLKLT